MKTIQIMVDEVLDEQKVVRFVAYYSSKGVATDVKAMVGDDVDSVSVFIPLNGFKTRPKRGDIYKIKATLLALCLEYPENLEMLEKIDFSGIVYSDKETKAFKEWEAQLNARLATDRRKL